MLTIGLHSWDTRWGGGGGLHLKQMFRKAFDFIPCGTEPHLCLLSGNKTKNTVTSGNPLVYIICLVLVSCFCRAFVIIIVIKAKRVSGDCSGFISAL